MPDKRTSRNDHPVVADIYNNMGVAYVSKGNLAKALEYHEKVLCIRIQALGEGHGFGLMAD